MKIWYSKSQNMIFSGGSCTRQLPAAAADFYATSISGYPALEISWISGIRPKKYPVQPYCKGKLYQACGGRNYLSLLYPFVPEHTHTRQNNWSYSLIGLSPQSNFYFHTKCRNSIFLPLSVYITDFFHCFDHRVWKHMYKKEFLRTKVNKKFFKLSMIVILVP